MQIIETVVGGQYGSEAKGHVTAQLVKRALNEYDNNPETPLEVINIRVAGPNAGHTAYDDHGQKFAFRQIPVGAVIDPRVRLYIAPGSEIDLDVLYHEINLCETYGWSVADRLYISKQATIIDAHHKVEETKLVGAVGSTGKGIGAARADRLMRGARTMGQYHQGTNTEGLPWEWAEPEDLYATDEWAHNHDQHIIIEGTQGYGLSLHASGHYPQVTSSDARAIDFQAMAGIDPTRCHTRCTNWVVARVYPIRVAGNSGPMDGETTWDDLGLPAERTTVTQKIRRVGTWDPDLVARAIQANGGHNAKLVITMLDQVIPELADMPYEDGGEPDNLHPALIKASDWCETHASYATVGAHVAGITFGPDKMYFTEHAVDNPESTIETLIDGLLAGLLGKDEDNE